MSDRDDRPIVAPVLTVCLHTALAMLAASLLMLPLGSPWLFAATPPTFLAMALVLRRRYPVEERRPHVGMVRLVATGIALGVLGALAAAALERGLRIAGVEVSEQPWLVELAAGGIGARAFLVVFACVLAPPAEELFFRGHVFRLLDARSRRWAAYAVSTALFAAIHAHPPMIPSYVLLGVLLAWSYERWRSLVVPVAAHATINALGVGWLIAGAT